MVIEGAPLEIQEQAKRGRQAFAELKKAMSEVAIRFDDPEFVMRSQGIVTIETIIEQLNQIAREMSDLW